MFSAVDRPHVIVTVNGLKSVCNGNCSYSFMHASPVIESYSFVEGTNETEIWFQLSDPEGRNYSLDTLEINIGTLPCENRTGQFTNFTCSIPKTTFGLPVASSDWRYAEIWID